MKKISESKECLDKIIKKARVHLYKPIQVAEILYRDRVKGDIDLSILETYRTKSRQWRDEICMRFLGRISTSSMRYQDDVFNDNATPPPVLISLGAENKKKSGIVEAYIYRQFEKKFTQMLSALSYCQSSDRTSFQLEQFLDIFWKEPGLKRSIDKIYEIVVYSLFEVLVEELDISVEVFIGSQKNALLKEFEDFAKKVLCLDSTKPSHKVPARFNRVGVTNAADRGLDMWANYGPAVQIKHLSLDEDLAEEIVNSVSADRIIIVCMDSEQKVIVSLLNQIGWKSRIQAIITQKELILWYEKALRGSYAKLLGAKLLSIMISEIKNEFPTISSGDFDNFVNERGYGKLNDKFWNIRQDG